MKTLAGPHQNYGVRIAAVAALTALISPSPAIPGHTSPVASATRLTGNTAVLPIVMVREFPFVEGEVAGVRGKLMLDTGMQEALVINDHRVPLVGGTRTGTGFFGSGQTFDIRRHAAVDGIRIGRLHVARASNVQSQDARMLEKITPDFLGWIGYGFFKDYALKMDYRRSEATFYKEGPRRYLQGEKVIAVLAFETRKLPNHPLLKAKIGGVDAIVSLDTGMDGALMISNARKAQLIADGHLKPAMEPDEYDLASVRVADAITIDLPALEVGEGPSPAAKSIGISEDTELELGYAFLKQYKTVWDFRKKRLYLLAP